MSSLNLVPNPTIMVIQAGLFLANFVVVKKFLLEPFMKVHEERVKMTLGSQGSAEQLDRDSAQSLDQIQARLQQVSAASRSDRESTLAQAKARRDELLAQASGEAQQVIANVRQDLSREIEEQRRRIPELVQSLSRQLVDKIVPA